MNPEFSRWVAIRIIPVVRQDTFEGATGHVKVRSGETAWIDELGARRRKKGGRRAAFPKFIVFENLDQVVTIGLKPENASGPEGIDEFSQRGFAVLAAADDLGQERIVVDPYLGA